MYYNYIINSNKDSMKAFNIPHIAILIKNLEKTKHFYTSIGFDLTEEIYNKEKKRWLLIFSGYGIEIEAFYYEAIDFEESNDEPNFGFMHFGVPTDNLEKIIKLAKKEGLKISKEITESSVISKYLNLEDPSGVTVEFFKK